MIELPFRFRRLRRSERLRALVRETSLSASQLILPVFVEEGVARPVPIPSMPGVVRHTESGLGEVVARARDLGIGAVMLFGVSHHKDACGSDTWNPDGLLARMIRRAKDAAPDMLVISDNCFCEYTDHGHCGVLDGEQVANDPTLANLVRQVLTAARAGVDMVAPSGMMDGMIAAIRTGLDGAGFSHLPVMSYSTKFASAFYGPFRDAVDSSFKGNRAGYQLDAGNGREALAESVRDEEEGADILMVKPGIAYLDVLAAIRARCTRPLAVYQVSGEYAMIKAAAAAGLMDERALVMETMTAFRRAGADMILSYFAEDVARWLRSG
ncbi:MAG: Delta-aminolevulinic acid dehydratase [Pseudomonadales bacterium]|nr:Delta-aminolevulinic acid dehydratase [Pseudomonadales bacterium]